MKFYTNLEVINHVLNELCKDEFSPQEDYNGVLASRRFEVREVGFYEFDVYRLVTGKEMGQVEEELLAEEVTLAEVINVIKKAANGQGS